jgi:hypothetical protein
MPKNNICVNKEYVENEQNYSAKSLQWITYLEKVNNCVIQSAFRGREAEIEIKNTKKIKVDGYNKEINTIYKFNQCYENGCQKCYQPDDYNEEKIN